MACAASGWPKCASLPSQRPASASPRMRSCGAHANPTITRGIGVVQSRDRPTIPGRQGNRPLAPGRAIGPPPGAVPLSALPGSLFSTAPGMQAQDQQGDRDREDAIAGRLGATGQRQASCGRCDVYATALRSFRCRHRVYDARTSGFVRSSRQLASLVPLEY